MTDRHSTPQPPYTGQPPEPERMTRERAIELLRTDVKAWNKWRKENPTAELPDLSQTRFSSAHLEGANLARIDLERADLWGAHFEGAVLQDAKLNGVYLRDAHLEGANLEGARLEGATLPNAHLEGADLTAADFSNADVTGVTYDRTRGKFRGIRVATCYGHALFVRDAQDQDYIETYRAQHPIRGWFWHHLTDSGRSLVRVALIGIAVALLFGVVYATWPAMLNMSASAQTPWTPYYYSLVTFTTLGFGDVTPATLAGELWVGAEVIAGYLMLGLLVSILANKVARRA
ncbi:MAG: pentapeptide repeat-containing protein [Planctomycetes bacterium]|nr:pentapeptide repeat-containing protein [Planctomycetota bacterium]